MRAPLSWINEFVEIPAAITPEQISDGLIRVGFEVEEIINSLSYENYEFILFIFNKIKAFSAQATQTFRLLCCIGP